MLIDQLLIVPSSKAAKSATANLQVPLIVGVRFDQLVEAEVCVLPVGPKPFLLSAAKVPVRGAGAPLIGLVEVELISVFTK